MIGTVIVYIIMICAVLGAIGAIRDAEYGIGKEFMNGIHTVGHIFVPAAGIMAVIPYLTWFISHFISPIFEFIGADPAIAKDNHFSFGYGWLPISQCFKRVL